MLIDSDTYTSVDAIVKSWFTFINDMQTSNRIALKQQHPD